MVVGYLDIFVFEELGFAVRPVVDGFDGAFKSSYILAYFVDTVIGNVNMT